MSHEQEGNGIDLQGVGSLSHAAAQANQFLPEIYSSMGFSRNYNLSAFQQTPQDDSAHRSNIWSGHSHAYTTLRRQHDLQSMRPITPPTVNGSLQNSIQQQYHPQYLSHLNCTYSGFRQYISNVSATNIFPALAVNMMYRPPITNIGFQQNALPYTAPSNILPSVPIDYGRNANVSSEAVQIQNFSYQDMPPSWNEFFVNSSDSNPGSVYGVPLHAGLGYPFPAYVPTSYADALNAGPVYAASSSASPEYAEPSSPGPEYAASSSPGLEYAASSSPGLEYAASSSPGPEYAASSGAGLEYADPSSAGQVYRVRLSVGQVYAAPSSAGQVNGVRSSAAQAHATPSSAGRVYGIRSSEGQAYVAPSSEGQAYVAPSSAGQVNGVRSSAGQAYAAPSSAGRAYGVRSVAPSSAGQAYAAPSSARQAHAAPSSARQAYAAPSSTDQVYGVPSSPVPTNVLSPISNAIFSGIGSGPTGAGGLTLHHHVWTDFGYFKLPSTMRDDGQYYVLAKWVEDALSGLIKTDQRTRSNPLYTVTNCLILDYIKVNHQEMILYDILAPLGTGEAHNQCCKANDRLVKCTDATLFVQFLMHSINIVWGECAFKVPFIPRMLSQQDFGFIKFANDKIVPFTSVHRLGKFVPSIFFERSNLPTNFLLKYRMTRLSLAYAKYACLCLNLPETLEVLHLDEMMSFKLADVSHFLPIVDANFKPKKEQYHSDFMLKAKVLDRFPAWLAPEKTR